MNFHCSRNLHDAKIFSLKKRIQVNADLDRGYNGRLSVSLENRKRKETLIRSTWAALTYFQLRTFLQNTSAKRDSFFLLDDRSHRERSLRSKQSARYERVYEYGIASCWFTRLLSTNHEVFTLPRASPGKRAKEGRAMRLHSTKEYSSRDENVPCFARLVTVFRLCSPREQFQIGRF